MSTSGAYKTYLGQGDEIDIPDPATHLTNTHPDLLSFYYAVDTMKFYRFDRVTVAWVTVPIIDYETPFMATAVGTGVSQNVLLPVSGLSVQDVIVTVNGIVYKPTTDYTIATNQLTLTTNAAADEIVIFENRMANGGTVVDPVSGAPWWFVPPLAADFAANLNIGSLTVSDDADVGLVMRRSAGGISAILKAVAPNVNFEATARIEYSNVSNVGNNACIIIGNAALNKFLCWGPDTRWRIHWMRYTNTAYDGVEALITPGTEMPKWWRVNHDDATGIVTMSVSPDGKNWFVVATHNVGSYFGADPAYLGLGLVKASGTEDQVMSVAYWADDL